MRLRALRGIAGIEVEKVYAYGRDPVAATAAFLQRRPADVIVLATHQRDGLAGWRQPSVAQAIARHVGEVALFVLDVILGSGSHPDPAGALGPALAQARTAAEAAGGHLYILASLCGTEEDSQGYLRQRAALEASGVLVARSSSMTAAAAGRVAALLAEVAR